MWGAWFANSQSGAVGPQIPLGGDSGSADITLNDIDTWSLKFPDSFLDTVPMKWWYPWMGSVLIMHKCETMPDWQPWSFGPITEWPKSSTTSLGPDGAEMLMEDISGNGMREFLKYRFITGPAESQSLTDMAAMEKSTVTFTKMSLGTIQEELTKLALNRTSGVLPIRFDPSLRQANQDDDDSHRRSYDGYNVSNNDADKLITDLSNVIGGPDYMLHAGLDTSSGYWQAYTTCTHGVEGQPQIPQKAMLSWDATAPGGPVSSYEVSTDSGTITTRSYATGAGEGAAIVMQAAQNDAQLNAGMPLLERTTSYESITNLPPLLAHAKADLAAGAFPTVQVTTKIRADHPQSAIGLWRVGDRVRMKVPYHRWLSHGEYIFTIIGAKVDLTSEDVTLSLQVD